MSDFKVGYVVKRFPRASETFIAQEVLALERLGADVTVLSLRPNDSQVGHAWLEELRAPVHVYEERGFSPAWRDLQKQARRGSMSRERVHEALIEAFDHPERSGRRYLVEALWVAEHVQALGLDHLHAHFANHPTFVAMLSGLLAEVPYSFTAHAKDIYTAGPTQELWRRQVERAAFAVTVSDANRFHLRSVLGRRLMSKLHRLYNGVDLGWVKPGLRERSDTAVEVLFVSRLVEKKGADILLEALARLIAVDAPVQLTVVGDGDQTAALRDQAVALGVTDRVRFAGALPHHEVVERMGSADLFVLPCRIAADGDRDALPTVLLEAMAVGLPCVSTPVNGVAEIVEDGKTGLLVPVEDSESLAEAISSLAADPARRRVMAAAGRARVEERFDIRRNVAQLREWMRQAASTAVEPAKPATTMAFTTRGAG
jgi:glycosyltransferase involved in cell wall biosynthesis